MNSRELTLLLLRHGQTDSNAAGIVQGHLPVPLNDLGHRQAAALAARLAAASPRIGRLISSDLSRAAQTAESIARALAFAPGRIEDRDRRGINSLSPVLRGEGWGKGRVMRDDQKRPIL